MNEVGSTWAKVSTREELQEIVGLPTPPAAAKVRDRLGEMHRAFIAAAPFWLIATSSAEGRCDISPKGDPAGTVLALDERTLVLPDRPGNHRVDGFMDVLDNPHVGVLFIIPGRGDTLRVNGAATLVRDATFFDDLVVAGHRPRLALVVDVEEVFFHCAKAFMRSKLWDPTTWQPDRAPSRARIAQALERPDESLADLEAHYGPSYADGLYRDQ